ncbi:hypothetical protein CHARACLAT_004724, partial [Characodon lateralis]|nr:hypothetical protein [Characodon lateralis]
MPTSQTLELFMGNATTVSQAVCEYAPDCSVCNVIEAGAIMYPPFFDDNPFGIYQKILSGKLEFPRHLDFYVKDLIKKFLVIDRARRLGNMK